MLKEHILVGRFGAAHGIKGEVRLKSFTGDPRAIASYAPLLDASGRRQFTIKTLRHVKDDLFVATITGIDDRASAEALTNVELFVPHASLPEPEADEFYRADLLGLRVLDEAGAMIGRVADVLDFGGGDILEIVRPEGGETLLLPFTKAIVPIVDVAAGNLTIVPPVEIEGEAPAPSSEDKPPFHRRKAPAPSQK